MPLTNRTDYYRSKTDEPHITRRKEILKAHPEIETLFGPDIRPVPYVLMIMATQLSLAYFQKYWSWQLFIFIAWSIGGTASHALSLMTHELSHNSILAISLFM